MPTKKEDHIIVAIHVTDRVKQASRVQEVLTEYGSNIKTRIGLHEATGALASHSGVILLEMVGPEKRCLAIIGALVEIAGVEAKSISFQH